MRAATRLTAAGRAVVLRLTAAQVRFTALNAVGLVTLLSGILSFLVISQLTRELNGIGATELLLRLDSLAREAHSLATENRSDLRLTVTNLTEASRQLNNFVDQMSRRPFRALTGVKPLPPRDTTRTTNDSGRGASPLSAKP